MNIPIEKIEPKIIIKPKCDDIKCCFCNKTININIKYNKAKTFIFIRALTT